MKSIDNFRQILRQIQNLGMSSRGFLACGRFAGRAKGKGKRGGARIIYLLIPKPGLVYLFYAYTKGDITDVRPEQKKLLVSFIEDIKKEHKNEK